MACNSSAIDRFLGQRVRIQARCAQRTLTGAAKPAQSDGRRDGEEKAGNILSVNGKVISTHAAAQLLLESSLRC
jgi:hypothetical protein